MQLRKVCNHPNLFEPRQTVSPFTMERITYTVPSLVISEFEYDPLKHVNLRNLNLLLQELSFFLSAFAQHRIRRFQASPKLIEEIDSAPAPPPRCPPGKIKLQIKTTAQAVVAAQKLAAATTSRPHANAYNRSLQQFRAYHALHPSPQAAASRTLPANLSNDSYRANTPRPTIMPANAIASYAFRTSPGFYTARQQPRGMFSLIFLDSLSVPKTLGSSSIKIMNFSVN